MSRRARVAVLGSKSTCARLVTTVRAIPEIEVVQIFTIDDRGDARSRLDDLVTIGKQLSHPTYVADPAPSAYAELLALDVDIVLVAGWYRIIPDQVLDAVRLGFFGMHYSKLPSYRGSAPVVWALLNGEPSVGYSLFKMSPGMDEGLLAGQGEVSVGKETYIADVLDALDHASLKLLAEILPSLSRGLHPLIEQGAEGLSFAGARNADDGRINWNHPADDIARQVRAQSFPYPGAFSTLAGDRVTIWRAAARSDAAYYGVPGQILRLMNGLPVVACGGGTGLIIEQHEPAGAALKFSLLSSRFS